MHNFCKHWSEVEWLHKTVKNPNIVITGTHSYFSGYFDGNFEDTAVRYLYGDAYSTHQDTGWTPIWEIDKLIIGDYVQIAAGVNIIMGGNNTHNPQFISTYPFLDREALKRTYQKAGDTLIGNDVWLGMGSLILPGITIGNGAIIAAHSVVTRDVPDYHLVAGNPAKLIRQRFKDEDIASLQQLKWWEWPDHKVKSLLPLIQSNRLTDLISASQEYAYAFESDRLQISP